MVFHVDIIRLYLYMVTIYGRHLLKNVDWQCSYLLLSYIYVLFYYVCGIHVDVDECTEDSTVDCGPHADCYNSPGSYRCDCYEGYEKNNNTGECEGKLLS